MLQLIYSRDAAYACQKSAVKGRQVHRGKRQKVQWQKDAVSGSTQGCSEACAPHMQNASRMFDKWDAQMAGEKRERRERIKCGFILLHKEGCTGESERDLWYKACAGPNDGCSQQGWQLRMQLVDWRVQPGRLLPKRVPVILKFAQLPQICPAAVSSLLSTSCSWASRLAACPFAAAAAAHAAAPPASRPALPCG